MNWKRLSLGAAVSLAGLSLSGVASAKLAPHIPGEFIVKMKRGVAESELGSFKSLGVEVQSDLNVEFGSFYKVKSFADKVNTEELLAALNADPSVEYAEPNYIYEIVRPIKEQTLSDILSPVSFDAEYATPNDPKFGQLWGLRNTGNNEPSGGAGVAGADIDALKAWDITTGDRTVKIAVIDTGIDYRHPDLAENMWTNSAEANGRPGVDDDGNGFIDDIHGYDFANNDGDPMDGNAHGTHCAGTIGAVHNNGVGVAGVMDNVTFVAVKFLSDSGSGSLEGAIKSIDYATKMNVDLMSNSWGGGGRSEALKEAIERANAAGIVFTAAAGNSGTNNDSSPHYPSNYEVENVISVAATTAQNGMASFSCYGRNTVHIGAPGHRILSSTPNGNYEVFSGTSMATPHVSGAIGLLIAHEGRMNPKAVRERVIATSEPTAALRGKTINGGSLNAYNLLTDTRPARNEPKPGAWRVVSLDEAWESAHPYADNASEQRVFSYPGAKYMRLKVKKHDLENRYDYLEVADAHGAVVEKVSGSGTDYASDYIEGETMVVTFKSDRSVSKWGFEVVEFEVQ